MLTDGLGRLKGIRGPDGSGWYTGFFPSHDDERRPNLRFNEKGFDD